MLDRKTALRSIAVGEIFHAQGGTASRICLALKVGETAILARNVTTQQLYEFDRTTGIATQYFNGVAYDYTIDSVAALPDDIREIMLGLDRKYRQVEYRLAEDPDYVSPLEQSALTAEQRRGLRFVYDFYRANPLPEPSSDP